ncbi:hypothetical protein GGR54DRAFT_610 [Hypoxylon sp. NC1633]|nr:hypothetical protein GGR54DRAFT_610 [Hypoxylon sp. NC1633]
MSAKTVRQTNPSRKPKSRPIKVVKSKAVEPGSLYDIIGKNGKLYCLPAFWTDFHVQVLGCRFQELPPVLSTPWASSSKLEIPTPAVVNIGRAAHILAQTSPVNQRIRAMSAIMDMLFPGRLSTMSSELGLRFGQDYYIGQEYTVVPGSFLWTRGWEDPLDVRSVPKAAERPCDKPVLAYVDLGVVQRRRLCFSLRRCPDGGIDECYMRYERQRIREREPQDLAHDHHIFATMLTMAQQHAYPSVSVGDGFSPKDVPVSVITLSHKDKSFVIYRSVIPSALLCMFDNPHEAPPTNVKAIIKYKRVPIYPLIGLKERLGSALGRIVMGPSYPQERTETFTYNLVPGSGGAAEHGTPEAPKRKALLDVYNSSFCEDRNMPGSWPEEQVFKRIRADDQAEEV